LKHHEEYIRDALAILSKRGIRVLKIEATRTYHGRHYYFHLAEPVEARTANRLQYLLGDDPNRVDYNRARIDSGLVGWNKLFEAVGRKLKTLYLAEQQEPRPHSIISACRLSRHNVPNDNSYTLST
jgi:hypothetical protein